MHSVDSANSTTNVATRRRKMKTSLVRWLMLLACVIFVTQGWAQEVKTEVARGEVVYVSGNDVVVKMESGEVKHVTVAPGATAVVDGKTITIKDLKPGMKLQRTITTTTTPRTVTTTRTVSGKVWHVSGNNVILTLPSGENKQYKVPEGTKFNIDGQEKTVFDLRKGMNVSATVVTTAPEVVVTQKRDVTGTAPPPPPPPPTPAQVGVLLIEEPAPAPKAVAAAPAPEPAPATLPKTASSLPLVGLLGVFLTAAGFGLRALRRMI
jgi:hypothetical protein